MFISHQILRIRTWWRYTPGLTTNILYDLFLRFLSVRHVIFFKFISSQAIGFRTDFPQIVGCRIWPSSFLLLTDGDWNLRNHAARQTCTVFVFCRFSFLIWVCVRPWFESWMNTSGQFGLPLYGGWHWLSKVDIDILCTIRPILRMAYLSIHSNIGLSVYLWRPTLCYQLDRKLVARFGLHNLSCTHRRCGRSPALSCVCFCLPLLLRLFPFWRPFCPLPHSASGCVHLNTTTTAECARFKSWKQLNAAPSEFRIIGSWKTTSTLFFRLPNITLQRSRGTLYNIQQNK